MSTTFETAKAYAKETTEREAAYFVGGAVIGGMVTAAFLDESFRDIVFIILGAILLVVLARYAWKWYTNRKANATAASSLT